MAANEQRTLKLITKRQRDAGVNWLGGKASLEEYEVAIWMQQRQITYIYQATFRLFSGTTTKVDFQVLDRSNLVFFVQGDRWHQGMDQRVYDREQEIAVENNPYWQPTVIEIWAHAVVAYPGFPVPTDASFERLMESAMRGEQISTAWGFV